MRNMGIALIIAGLCAVIYAFAYSVAVTTPADFLLGVPAQSVANLDRMEIRAMILQSGWALSIMGAILIAADHLKPADAAENSATS